jgi:ribosomal protein L29
MDMREICQLSPDQCRLALAEKQAELANLRFKVRQGQLKQVRQLRVVRTAIAQLHTRLGSVQLSDVSEVTVTA